MSILTVWNRDKLQSMNDLRADDSFSFVVCKFKIILKL